MSTNEKHVAAAAKVMSNAQDWSWSSKAQALDAAGLLVSELHVRALEACKACVPQFEAYRSTCTPEAWRIVEVGRSALAAEKKRERWVYEVVMDQGRPRVRDKIGMVTLPVLSEAQVAAIHAVLNALPEQP